MARSLRIRRLSRRVCFVVWRWGLLMIRFGICRRLRGLGLTLSVVILDGESYIGRTIHCVICAGYLAFYYQGIFTKICLE